MLNLGCTRHSSSQLGSALICTRFQAEVLVELYPRALPPVTQGSALQAPERMWGTIRSRIPSRGQLFIFVYRLAMDAKTRKGDDVAG